MSVTSGDRIRIVAKFRGPYWSEIQNVWGGYLTGSGSASDANCVDGVKSWLQAIYNALNTNFSTALSFYTAVVDVVQYLDQIWKVIYHVGDVSTLTGFAPSSAGDVAPPAVAPLVSFPTVIPRQVGKKYFSAFTEGSIDSDGELTTAAVTNLTSAAAQYLAGRAVPGSSLTLTPVILSPSTGSAMQPLTAVVSAALAYQRRRKLGRGI